MTSTKLATAVAKTWTIGPELGIEEINLDEEEPDDPPGSDGAGANPDAKIKVTSGSTPLPYIDIPEIGRVTGRVTLYEEKISGGKSEDRGASNGFLVNVLGRVVNQGDPSFGRRISVTRRGLDSA